MRTVLKLMLLAGALAMSVPALARDLWNRVQHRFTDNDGVKLHYVVIGRGPLVVMIHGFPDFWYSWRHQMSALNDRYRVVAVDLRGYNQSDKPSGVPNYAMPLLVSDIAAIIAAENQDSAVIVGHDWGGAIAWNVAMRRPELVKALVILNLPHPAGLARELKVNPEQRRNSQYAFDFQQPDAHKQLNAQTLADRVTRDPQTRARYVAAFENSDFEAMLNYYKANYPRPDAAPTVAPNYPKVKAPVLMFHGLEDRALLHGALSGTWEWLEQDLTLITIPGAGHFVQHDAPELVSNSMRDWLLRRVR